ILGATRSVPTSTDRMRPTVAAPPSSNGQIDAWITSWQGAVGVLRVVGTLREDSQPHERMHASSMGGLRALVRLKDRAVGCLVGLAIGDALGIPFRGRRVDPNWGHLRPPVAGGASTAFARNLVRSLGERGMFDGEDIVARHLAWFRSTSEQVESLTRAGLRRI